MLPNTDFLVFFTRTPIENCDGTLSDPFAVIVQEVKALPHITLCPVL